MKIDVFYEIKKFSILSFSLSLCNFARFLQFTIAENDVTLKSERKGILTWEAAV